MGFFDFEELDREAVGSVSEVLESIGADLGRRGRAAITSQEIVRGFIESTPMLTFGEHAQLLGGVIEDQRATLSAAAGSKGSSTSAAAGSRGSSTSSSGSRTTPRPSGSTSPRGASTSPKSTPSRASAPGASRSGTGASRPGSTSGRTSSGSGGIGNVFSDIASHIPKAASLVQQGAQAIQQLRSPKSAPPPTAAAGPEPSFAPGPDTDAPPQPAYASPPEAPPPFGSGVMGHGQAGFDPPGAMWQGLRQGQIPLLPGQLPSGTGQLAPPPMAPMPGARPPADAIAMLWMFLRLPQLQSALQSAAVLGPAGPRTMELPIPAAGTAAGTPAGTPAGMRNLQVPLGAVMNAIAALASRSMEELNASTQESDPEIPDYLVGEDGELLVDPAIAAERAALVTHMVRLNQAAQRAGWSVEAREADEDLDEAEAWARDAGF